MEFILALWKYLIATAPILLLGLGVAGIIHGFITIERIKKVLGANSIGSIFKAAILGIPLPLCSCGVIPAAVTLRKSGASNGATSSFLIATPESGIDSIAMTYAMMDLPMTIIRPIAAFLSAFIAGVLQFFFNDFEIKEEAPMKGACCSKNSIKEVKKNPVVTGAKFAFGDLINDMALWLTFGIVLGALIDYSIPVDWIESLNGWGGRLILLGVGIPLYICASATTPIAASLMMKGLSPGLALIILLTGPATNLANILVLQKYIGKKGIAINVATIAVVTLILSLLVDYIYTYYSWPLNFNIGNHEHNHGASWWEIASAVILTALLLKGIILQEVIPRLNKKKAGCH